MEKRTEPLKPEEVLPPDLARRLDPICDAFEAAWRAARSSGARPRIEDFLRDLPEPARALLLRELLLAEVHYRRQLGEHPQPEDYQARFPQLDPNWLAGAVGVPVETQTERRDPGAAATSGRNNAKRLGDFEILRQIGRGGMGVVYAAIQTSLNRKVALKVLFSSLGLTPKAVQRFRREAEAAARLHHTNIVAVHAIGEEEGTHFYAMELIDGPSLDQVIRQMRQTSKRHQSPEPRSDRDSPPSPGLAAAVPYVPESDSRPVLSASSLGSDSHYFDTVARMIAEVADALDYAPPERHSPRH